MSTSCPTDIDLRSAREASMVIVHHVPPELTDRFVELQEEITEAGKLAPGYVKTEVYPPAEKDSDQWVVVMTFTDHASLERWFECPERLGRVEKVIEEIGSFTIKKVPTGFGAWFARLDADGEEAAVDGLPGWKMVLVVLLALYPTVMLTTIFINPWISALGLAGMIMVGNALSVCLLQWALMPPLTAALQRWIRTPISNAPLLNIGGAVGIVAILTGMTFLFHTISG